MNKNVKKQQPSIWWKDQWNTQERVGMFLKAMRLHKKMSMAKAAAFIGCRASSIWALEHGRYGSLRLVEAYAWALGLHLGDLKVQAHSEIARVQAKKVQTKNYAAAAVRWVQKQRRPATTRMAA